MTDDKMKLHDLEDRGLVKVRLIDGELRVLPTNQVWTMADEDQIRRAMPVLQQELTAYGHVFCLIGRMRLRVQQEEK